VSVTRLFAARTIGDEKNIVKNIERYDECATIKKSERFAETFVSIENFHAGATMSEIVLQENRCHDRRVGDSI
jgi:hypothetical protein